MLSIDQINQLIQSLIWLLAGVGIFIVGMNFMSEALGKCAGEGMKKLLGKISNNRFSGVGIGAGVTAIVQSSSATTVMVIGLVNAGVMTLKQAIPIIMGSNIGTTVTGILVSLKNDYFNMLMYLLAFVGVMLGFCKKEKLKLIGLLFSGLGFVFVGLNVMGSDQAFGNPLVETLFESLFRVINSPFLLILVGVIFTALIQSSSAATGIVITMVGANILPIELALFIVLGTNIGTCVTALLASVGANMNSKRVALIHFAFNIIGTIIFTIVLLAFKEPIIQLIISIFPGDDITSLQMRVSVFHVIFNVTTTCILLPFVSQLVKYSCVIIKDKNETIKKQTLKYVDDRLLTMPSVALMQVKKEIYYMFNLVEENIMLSFDALSTGNIDNKNKIISNEAIIDFTNSALTKYLISLSSVVEQSDELIIGSYFHVLNDLERIGDHAENFYEVLEEMSSKKIIFSKKAKEDIQKMNEKIIGMLKISKDSFKNLNTKKLSKLTIYENEVDKMKKDLTFKHFSRLAEGNCNIDVSPYYTSVIAGLERVADHFVNIGYSIVNPVGSQKQN